MQPGSGSRGRARWHHLRDMRRRLRDRPYLGPKSQEHPGCRYFVCEGYVIVYQVAPDTGDTATAGDIIILALFGPQLGRRDLSR
jgi:plasmid stabilization system protein ParE